MRKILNPETFRQNIREKLTAVLENESHAKNLEIGIYNYSVKEATHLKVVKKWDNPYFVQVYCDRLRSIYVNLKNPALIQMLNSGDIQPHTIAFMTHQEMLPARWDQMIQDKIKRDKYKFEAKVEASTDTFTCGKCKSKKCTYFQQQTRSADEPMTTFVTCLQCDARWKC